MFDAALVEVSEYGDGVVNVGTGELVTVNDAPLPIAYERATKALAECVRIDECQQWANKAEAIASYARQSKDETLRKMADRIMARAIRRCGELLKQIPSGTGAHLPNVSAPSCLNRTEAATQAGLSERQKVTALRVASIPAKEFERVVESDAPPTKTRLSELGKAEKPQPLVDLCGIPPAHFARATELKGSLRRLAQFCEEQDPAAIAKAFKPSEVPEIQRVISSIESWLDRFAVTI